MQEYDSLIELLNIAENSVEHPAKSAALRNRQIAPGAEPNLNKELQKRMAAMLREAPGAIGAIPSTIY
jgi:hypothetical protein